MLRAILVVSERFFNRLRPKMRKNIDEKFLKYSGLSGAKACKSCRSRRAPGAPPRITCATWTLLHRITRLSLLLHIQWWASDHSFRVRSLNPRIRRKWVVLCTTGVSPNSFFTTDKYSTSSFDCVNFDAPWNMCVTYVAPARYFFRRSAAHVNAFSKHKNTRTRQR